VTGVELLPADEATPDNPEWHALRRAGITASEIAAVAGLSPWDSPFSIYHRKANGWEVADNEAMANGRRCEPVVADWWAETQDPLDNLAVEQSGLIAHPGRSWQLATPDRLIYRACPACGGSGLDGDLDSDDWLGACPDCLGSRPGTTGGPLAVLECKWTSRWDGWGDDADDIPVYYRAQLLWQMDVVGVDEGHLAVAVGGVR
jgi:putative phage-type endonuclease